MSPAQLLGCVLIFACCGCGKQGPAAATSAVPAEYRAYLKDGKVQRTGHATLDYWVHVNVFVSTLQQPANDLALPGSLKTLAKFIRQKPTDGVDTDVVRWANAVAGILADKADIMDKLNDPGTPRRAAEAAKAGHPNPVDALERASQEWERARNQLAAEGRALRETLSRRHGREFPSAQF